MRIFGRTIGLIGLLTAGAAGSPAGVQAAAAAPAAIQTAAAAGVEAAAAAETQIPASAQVKATPAAAPGRSGTPGPGRAVIAYVRAGDLYVSRGRTETRLTTDGGHARPRWSPDGTRLAYLTGGHLWVMRADGSGRRELGTRPAAGPSWSPDGRWLAFASLSCTGGPGVYRISVTAARPTPEVLFPRECRGEALPAAPPVAPKQAGSLTDRLRTDDAVAWSPDGTRMAFRGGDCESVYDTCLTVGTVATGTERTVAAYGGGSLQTSGFAVVPTWRSDGERLAFTAYQKGETVTDDQPVHVVELDPATGAERTVGGALDREMAYLDATHGVVTGQYRGGAWILLVGLADGSRVPLHAGSQPSVQPTR